MDDPARKLGRRVRGEGGEAQAGGLAGPDLVDIGRRDLDLDGQLGLAGTMVARRAAGVMTPPTVKTVSSLTMPAIGARISVRDSRSSLARRRSLSSETLASTRRSSRCASVRAVSSTAMIWRRASLMRSLARASEASISPRSPSRRAHSRLML